MRRKRSIGLLWKTSLVLMMAASLTAISLAQRLGTAVLNGDVTDPQGAVIKGAQVTATQTTTGAERATTTNSAGLFVFNDLPPGTYEVKVSANGFATTVATVKLEVGRQANLKIPLAIHQEKTTITIDDSANFSQVNTVSSVVDGVVTANQIDSLPLNGRNFAELSLLIPGNVPAPNFDPTKANTFLVSSAGQLGRGTNTSVDGSDDNDDAVGGMLINVPQDAVQEFQIATNRFSAEVGRSGSSVINVVTKSGTNSLHGLASFYERDKALQATAINLNPGAGSGTPPFRRQQYSGALGGPLVKDRAWWFGAFEYRDEIGGSLVGTRDVASQTISTSFAPAPLNDTLGTARGDWQVNQKDRMTFRYLIERQSSTGLSGVQTPLATALERQELKNNFHDFLTSWTRAISPSLLNKFSFSVNNFFNSTFPVQRGVEIDFPSITDGASFRVPQQTWQTRLQFDEGLAWTKGRHNLRFGTQVQRLDDKFYLAVFQSGRIIAVQNFADFDHNNDGVIDDEDLLFAVTLRSGFPDRPLILPNCDNNHLAFYAQDDWHLHPQLTLNLGLRYELDTDVNNVSGYANRNPIVDPFYHGNRHKDTNNWGPRVGFNWATKQGQLSVHGGYGVYYDRITLEIESLERGLDGRALPVEVRAGNAITDPMGNPVFIDPMTGHFVPGAPTLSNPFSGFIFPGAGAAGINIIDNNIQNPMVQQFDLGVQWEPARNWVVKVDGIHNLGTHFIIGVPVGSVFNPVVGGPDVVKNLESSVNTHYDALWLTVDKRLANHYQFHAAYTLAKALNYANDDQIPFSYPPLFPNDLHREYGPAPNDQRHRLVLQAVAELPWGLRLSPLWTVASGVPMDIKLPDNSSRVPQFMRNAGGRQFHNAAELNQALTQIGLPTVPSNTQFSDSYNTFDLRLSKDFRIREGMSIQALGEVFNLFNVTNILGVSNTNYSGFNNVISPDFGKPVSQAGGIFGSGGPRAFQLGAKLTF